jgi:hypothetical protein
VNIETVTSPQGSEGMNSLPELIFAINQNLNEWRHFESQYWEQHEEKISDHPIWINTSPEIVFGEDFPASRFLLYLLNKSSEEHHLELQNRYGIQPYGQIKRGRKSLYLRLQNNLIIHVL